jgi:hypothetical protein
MPLWSGKNQSDEREQTATGRQFGGQLFIDIPATLYSLSQEASSYQKDQTIKDYAKI